MPKRCTNPSRSHHRSSRRIINEISVSCRGLMHELRLHQLLWSPAIFWTTVPQKGRLETRSVYSRQLDWVMASWEESIPHLLQDGLSPPSRICSLYSIPCCNFLFGCILAVNFIYWWLTTSTSSRTISLKESQMTFQDVTSFTSAHPTTSQHESKQFCQANCLQQLTTGSFMLLKKCK